MVTRESAAGLQPRSTRPHQERDSAASRTPTPGGGRAERQLAQSPRMQAQQQTIQALFGPGVAQRGRGKTVANIMTLGLRKAVVYLWRKARQGAPAVVPQQQAQPQVEQPQAQDPLDRFVTAYGKARWYHQSAPSNLPSIEKHGLLNYADRPRVLGEQVYGMSRINKEYEGDEKKGVFLGPRKLMAESHMTSNVARAYLPSHRTKVSPASMEDETPSHEMFKDDKFRGGAAITKDSVPAEQVTTLSMLHLLDTDADKLNSILQAVGTQYGVDEQELPSLEQMKGHLREAIRTRRLSDAAFDNLE